MSSQHVRYLVRAGQVVFFVVAALVVRSHPIVAALLTAIATATFAVAFVASRAHEALVVAVERRDVDAIERIAEKHLTQRFNALVMLALVGGVARARKQNRSFCLCGECDADEIERDLERAYRALSFIEAGDARAAWRILQANLPKKAPPMSPTWVHMTALWAYAGILSGESRLLAMSPKLEKGFALMRWPLAIARARVLAAKGEVAASRAALAQVPAAWRAIV